MQQTTQSNRSGSKTASSAASPSRAPSSRPAAEVTNTILEEVTKLADPSEQDPQPESSPDTSPATEAEQEMGRLNLRSLPPNGLARTGRRERHMLHKPKPAKLMAKTYQGIEDNSHESPEPAEAAQSHETPDRNSSDVTRHGSFERDLGKLPRTRSHAKSESDLERPHQVSVTADGAGPPVTRAPLGS